MCSSLSGWLLFFFFFSPFFPSPRLFFYWLTITWPERWRQFWALRAPILVIFNSFPHKEISNFLFLRFVIFLFSWEENEEEEEKERTRRREEWTWILLIFFFHFLILFSLPSLSLSLAPLCPLVCHELNADLDFQTLRNGLLFIFQRPIPLRWSHRTMLLETDQRLTMLVAHAPSAVRFHTETQRWSCHD